MADSIKFLVVIVLLASLATQCLCACSLKDRDCLTTNLGKTNKTVQGKLEWSVFVVNNCKCDIASIILSCPGFKTVEPIDDKIFLCKPSGTGILLQGSALAKSSGVRFSYAWDQEFNLCPIRGTPLSPGC